MVDLKEKNIFPGIYISLIYVCGRKARKVVKMGEERLATGEKSSEITGEREELQSKSCGRARRTWVRSHAKGIKVCIDITKWRESVTNFS